MNRSKLKSYAPEARRDFIRAVTDRAAYYGLTGESIGPATADRAFTASVAANLDQLRQRIASQGFAPVMEAAAYTWFNRLTAIRFMEIHGYLDHGCRVLSAAPHRRKGPGGAAGTTPQILEHAQDVDLPGLDRNRVIELKLDGSKDQQLFRMILLAQCRALNRAMPFLFEAVDHQTELLLPDNLLNSDSPVRKLVDRIDEEDWQQVEIIGWLYQFYISGQQDRVIGKVVPSRDIPAATQFFTPNWIVKYLLQNSLGRKWTDTYPDSPLRRRMEYYVETHRQTAEVQRQLDAMAPRDLDPEKLTVLDPACGSGHILVEAYDLLKAIYRERGYRDSDAAGVILKKNLYGLEIDDRAAQLASFALSMKARADDRRILESGIRPHVLAIQESKGLNPVEITEALNAPLKRDERAAETGRLNRQDLDRHDLDRHDLDRQDVARLVDLFDDGKTFGSLVRVPEDLAEKLPGIARRIGDVVARGSARQRAAAGWLGPLVDQARRLAARYDVVAANPPYMGSNRGMNELLKRFARREYPHGKSDLFAMFIQRGTELTTPGTGFTAMVVMEAWMFLSSFARFRQWLLDTSTLVAMNHMPFEGKGPTTMGIGFGTVALVTAAVRIEDYRSHVCCVRHTDLDGTGRPTKFPVDNGRPGHVVADHFRKVPGSPLAYWAGDRLRDVFSSLPKLATVANAQVGLQTSHNRRFVRYWFELDFDRIAFHCGSSREAAQSGKRWFPHHKGGGLRKWYGNRELVVNWECDGREIKQYVARRYPYLNGNVDYVVKDRGNFFRPGVTWSHSTSGAFSCRFVPQGSISNVEGPTVFADHRDLLPLLGLLNAKTGAKLLGLLNGTLHFLVGTVRTLPVPYRRMQSLRRKIEKTVTEALSLARSDWDCRETSRDFPASPLLRSPAAGPTIGDALRQWDATCRRAVLRMKSLEEENNRLFIDAYGLQGELSPDVAEEHVTLRRGDRPQDVRRLLSYAVGCAMGRYSLDRPGLVYAGSGNRGFDPGQYRTFPADPYGVLPVTDAAWFDGDATDRVVQFIATAWPQEHLQENLALVAESLGPRRGESPPETIRRYLSQGFFKDHLKRYSNRPIYWLFSSGKAGAFRCLVYLHRYNRATLSRLGTEYVVPLLGKIDARIQRLADDLAAAASSSYRNTLKSQSHKLIRQQAELRLFHEKLRHWADRQIDLDLDDGVSVNYGKFGDLLAEVKAVAGQQPLVASQ